MNIISSTQKSNIKTRKQNSHHSKIAEKCVGAVPPNLSSRKKEASLFSPWQLEKFFIPYGSPWITAPSKSPAVGHSHLKQTPIFFPHHPRPCMTELPTHPVTPALLQEGVGYLLVVPQTSPLVIYNMTSSFPRWHCLRWPSCSFPGTIPVLNLKSHVSGTHSVLGK